MNILTFDIEDWFIINDSNWIDRSAWKDLPSRIEKNTCTILNMLQEEGTKATFFILGWVAENFPQLVKEIVERGHDIGFHSYYHVRPFRQSAEEFEADLIQGLELLERLTGQKITKYRAPNLSVTNETLWVYPILSKHGITISSSVRSFTVMNNVDVRNYPVRIKTNFGSITEFPLNRLNFKLMKVAFSGSGFFRLSPFWALNHLFRNERYNMAYFHPRDFDPDVPRHSGLSCYRNWKQSVNSANTLPKFNALLKELIFNTLEEANDIYGNENLPVIDLSARMLRIA